MRYFLPLVSGCFAGTSCAIFRSSSSGCSFPFFCVQVFGFYSIRFVAKGLLKGQIKVALDWNEKNALCFCS